MITAALTLVGLLLLIPVAVLLLEVLAAFLPERTSALGDVQRTRFAVLVPAHDEAVGIVATLASIRPQMTSKDRLVVIADNCTDDTQKLAAQAGAEVIVRQDPSRRGKGYALDFGIRHLVADAPDVVIVMDADCMPGPGCLQTIAALAAISGRPVQAYYRVDMPALIKRQRPPAMLMATFASRVKNLARPLGMHRLGLPCQLMGTGMAFRWQLIAGADLANAEIVEDLVLGLNLAQSGYPPLFCPNAAVSSPFPGTEEGQDTQRARWETGHLTTIMKSVPKLLFDAIRRRDIGLLALALDAAVPPLAFLCILLFGYAALSSIHGMLSGVMLPLAIAAAGVAMVGAAIVLGWIKVGRDVVSFYELALAPAYIVSKLGLYCRILMGRRVEWIRSRRD
jgi:cellulose synthase/poly-beta-1,6-N-acetylglucosamine synthase-like glycosyltransferase